MTYGNIFYQYVCTPCSIFPLKDPNLHTILGNKSMWCHINIKFSNCLQLVATVSSIDKHSPYTLIWWLCQTPVGCFFIGLDAGQLKYPGWNMSNIGNFSITSTANPHTYNHLRTVLPNIHHAPSITPTITLPI